MGVVQDLSERLDPALIKQRSAGRGMMLDYISIDTTINRLNEVLDTKWDFNITGTHVQVLGEETPRFLYTVVGELLVLDEEDDRWISHSGIGADIDKDPDKAAKTALAECIKKSTHQLGLGLYLWDEKEREAIAEWRNEHGTTQEDVRRDSRSAGDSGSRTTLL
jgi:hypothetical protein